MRKKIRAKKRRVVVSEVARGKLLTAIIVATLVFHLNALYQLNHAGVLKETFAPTPKWLEISVLLGSIAGIVTSVGLYFWKQWAVRLLIGITVVTLIFQIFFLDLGKFQETSFYLTITVSLLWYVAIARKWEQFK